MLAYQLGKLVYSLLDLTVNAVINPEHAQKTWDGYIEPISGLIDALKNRQLSLRDGIRAGTALAVQMKAQAILAKGCETLYSVAKTRVITYAAKNTFSDFIKEHNNAFLNPATSIPHETQRFSSQVIEQSVKWAMHDNKIGHIFQKKRHGMDLILDQVNGNKEVVVRKVIASISAVKDLPVFGKFENFRVMIMGYEIDVSGFVSDGVIKLRTVFIPEELQNELERETCYP